MSEQEEKNGIVLPTQIEKASREVPKTMIIYGLEKSGKTSILTTLPNCLLVDTEDGSDFVDGLKIKMPPEYGPKSKRKWLKDLAAQIKAEGKPYDFVAIDTFSELDMLSEWWGTTDYMKSNIGKSFNRDAVGIELKYGHPDYLSVLTLKGSGDFSPGYKWMRDSMLDMYETLKDLGKICTIFVCHVQDKMVAKEQGKEVMSKDLALTGKVRSILPRIVDATGHVWHQNGDMMVSFISDTAKMGGTRGTYLPGYSGKLDWNFIFRLNENK